MDLLKVIMLNSVLNSKHDLLPTKQEFELETNLEGQNNAYF